MLGHLPGLSSTLEQRLAEVPRNNGPYCVLSFEAVAALHARISGVKLNSWFPEWKAPGLPVEGIHA